MDSIQYVYNMVYFDFGLIDCTPHSYAISLTQYTTKTQLSPLYYAFYKTPQRGFVYVID